jgi:hypothetical protein
MSQIYESTLKKFMKPSTRAKLGNHPTTHLNCMAVTGGVARPGKTARDKANGLVHNRDRSAQNKSE